MSHRDRAGAFALGRCVTQLSPIGSLGFAESEAASTGAAQRRRYRGRLAYAMGRPGRDDVS
jgi:hypothetical protein